MLADVMSGAWLELTHHAIHAFFGHSISEKASIADMDPRRAQWLLLSC